MGKIVPDDYKGQWDFTNSRNVINESTSEAQEMLEYSNSNQTWRDYHANFTIYFGELIDNGFDWGRNDWPCINEDVRTRLISKIENQYRFREICEAPPAKFKLFITRKLNLIMPKYNEMYKVIEADRFDILETEQYYDKNRDVFSEYPQSQIQGSADYASNANDKEGKGKKTGPVVDMMNNFAERYTSIDNLVVNELETCFISMTSSFINAF